MSDLFKAGVSKNQNNCERCSYTLDKLLADIKNRKDRVSFGRKYPAELDTVKSDLKQTRQLLYGVVEKPNFPE